MATHPVDFKSLSVWFATDARSLEIAAYSSEIDPTRKQSQ